MHNRATTSWLRILACPVALVLASGAGFAATSPRERTVENAKTVAPPNQQTQPSARWRQTPPSETPQPTPARARAIVQPLYDALNRPATKDVDALLLKATTDDFTSCANETECGDRAYLAARFKKFGTIMPDLRWDITDVWVTGDKVFVLGQASGTPIAPLFGTAPTGRGFKTMSLDMFIIRGDKIAFSYHVENWLSALQQISGR